MEAQSLLPKSLTPSIRNLHKPILLHNYRHSISFGIRRGQCVHRIQCINNAKTAKPVDVSLNDKSIIAGVGRKKLAVFVSGGGSNFKSIHEACLQGLAQGDVAVLVTSKEDCGGAEYARSSGIPTLLFPGSKGASNRLSSSELVDALRRYEVDFILLAGYMKLIPVELVRAYPRRIFNIHPSLLPAFGGKGYYGMNVHKAVIASGARYTGPTIHIVDEEYDTGRIIAQSVVPVFPYDSAEELAARVLQQEHRLYVEVVTALCEDRIKWREDGVPLIQSKDNPDEFS